MTFVVHAFGDTNKGLFREINEDNLMVGRTIFAVADGMGGHAAGEVASAAALEPLQAIDGSDYTGPDLATQALADAVRQANHSVIERADADPDLRGMGTTLTTVMVRDRHLHLAHVGDSRAYLLREGMLEPLTDDHTLVNELVKEGRLTPQQAATHPQRSVITRAIGVDSALEVDVISIPLELVPGDQVLLCSDGLTGPVSESLIAEILRNENDGNLACQRLIDAANAGGGPDNITCVLLRIEGEVVPGPAPVTIPRASNDDDATAELGDPSALDARRLAELTNGDPEIESAPAPAATSRARRIGGIVVGTVLIAAILLSGVFLLLDRQFYVGVNDSGEVGVYQGIQGSIVGVSLSTLVDQPGFGLDDLPERLHQGLQDGISFGTQAEAETHVQMVLLPATQEIEPQGAATPAPEQTREPTSPGSLTTPAPTFTRQPAPVPGNRPRPPSPTQPSPGPR